MTFAMFLRLAECVSVLVDARVGYGVGLAAAIGRAGQPG